jgi:hypothetical protein
MDFGKRSHKPPYRKKKSSSKKRTPCISGKIRSRTTGRCVLIKKVKTKSSKEVSRFDVKDAKNKLKTKAMSMSNLKTAPSWISTFRGVPGPNSAEKVGRINRLLSACKRMGISIVNKNTNKTYKSFSTLKTQCGVRFTKENKGVPSKKTNSLRSALARLRNRKNANKPVNEVILNPDIYNNVHTIHPEKEEEFHDSNDIFEDDFLRAVNTPLPDENEFGRPRRRRY